MKKYLPDYFNSTFHSFSILFQNSTLVNAGGDSKISWQKLLLDRMLPGINGTKLLARLRHADIQTPVILVTALGEIQERVQGLDMGADDYLVKPIAFEELMARIRSIQRRPRHLELEQTISFEDITFDPQTKMLSCGEISCSLSKKEGDLLEVFLKSPQQILARNVILTKFCTIATGIILVGMTLTGLWFFLSLLDENDAMAYEKK